ncbi:site-specific recombinase XerD [Desulfitispora alkaliphila]|uniref:site-specific tyrosine recombinase/integron integrase n=1 Tax=Desulfitispora alkaliphila TaxID=622674 RepID=UPI003D21FF34
MKFLHCKDNFLLYLEVELNRSIQTINGYKKDLSYFHEFILKNHFQEDPSIVDINTLHLRTYLSYLKHEKKYAPRSIARSIATIKSFFKFCFEEELLAKNPAQKIHAPKIPTRPPKYLEQEEIRKLFDAAARDTNNSYRDLAIIKTLYYTGIRVSEMVEIKLEDIDLKSSILHIQSGKGQKYREIPLNDKVKKAIFDYINKERIPIRSPYLFLSSHNKQFSTQYIRKILKKHAEVANLDTAKVTPHVLRHSFATALYKDYGVDLNRISKLLGHASINTTTIYTHTSTKHLMDAVDLL